MEWQKLCRCSSTRSPCKYHQIYALLGGVTYPHLNLYSRIYSEQAGSSVPIVFFFFYNSFLPTLIPTSASSWQEKQVQCYVATFERF